MLENIFGVGIKADGSMIHIFRLFGDGIILSRDSALNLAAWIVVLADPKGEDFGRLVKEARGD
jgi:hypothetical protein